MPICRISRKNTMYKLKCKLTCSFPVLSFLSVPFGGGAPFCASNLVFACCWADAWRFSAELPRRSTCCVDAEDGGDVVVTVECVNRLLPLSSFLVPSVFGLPGSRDGLEKEGLKLLCRNNNKSFSFIFKMHFYPYPFFWQVLFSALIVVTINTCSSSSLSSKKI
jgi:hypothetical protein